MNKQEQIKKIIIYIVFVFYILLLLKVLFLSRVSFFELFDGQRELDRSFNLIPLQSIIEFLSGNTEDLKDFSFANLVGNIAIFVPLGFCISLFRKDSIKGNSVAIIILIVFLVSFAAETIQWVFVIGTPDIDDIILNCIGGLAGILACKLFMHIIKNEKILYTIIAIISVIGLPIIIYYLLIIKMKF